MNKPSSGLWVNNYNSVCPDLIMQRGQHCVFWITWPVFKTQNGHANEDRDNLPIKSGSKSEIFQRFAEMWPKTLLRFHVDESVFFSVKIVILNLLWTQKRKLILDQSSGFKTFDKCWLCYCLSLWGVLQVKGSFSGHNVFLWLFSLLWLKKTQHLLQIKPISFSLKTNNKSVALPKSISKGHSTVLSKGIGLVFT